MKWWRTTVSALAITVSVSNTPSSIEIQQEFESDVVVDCISCGVSYLRGTLFYPESSHIYYGYTQNNSGQWISTTSDKTQYYKTEEGSFSGKLKFRFDAEKPPGPYFFKVGRYTSAGDGNADWSNQSLIDVVGPSPTPSSTPTPIPTQMPTPTLKPTPTPKPTAVPTPKPLPALATPKSVPAGTPASTLVTVTPLPSPEILSTQTSVPNFNWLAVGAVILGGGVFSFSLWHIIKGYVHPPVP